MNPKLQKAEILRLRLGLASYKVRTGQTDVPLERLQRFADRESKLTGYEFGGEITDCPSVLSYSEHAEIGGYEKSVLSFLQDV